MSEDSMIYAVGQIVVHPYSRTITHMDNMLATLGSLNTAQVHFNVERAKELLAGTFSERLVVGSCILTIVTGLASSGWGTPYIEELGLADLRFRTPLYAGDTVTVTSEILGVTSTAPDTTVIRARLIGINQHGDTLIEVVRTFGVRS